MTEEVKPLRKLARSQMRAYAIKIVKIDQGGLCPLCRKPIDLTIKGEGVIDHDHDTGEIRGVLHRSCNAAEGKIANAAGRWGAKSASYAAIVPYLEAVVEYLKRPGTGLMYPMHKTADDKRELRNQQARERRAQIKAKREMAAQMRRAEGG